MKHATDPDEKGLHGLHAYVSAATMRWGMRLGLLTGALLAPPLAAVALRGDAVEPYLRFPPLTEATAQPPFSWPVFLGLSALVTLFVSPYAVVVRRILRGMPASEADTPPVRTFPLWGWGGLALLAVVWVLAWTRWPAFEPFQRHTFTPLWLAYILVVNALTFRRTGRSLLTHHPGFFLALFPLSAAFWWFFEWLNRFVRNWHYLGIDDFSGLEYVAFASISFSTVLPAVLSTLAWLESHPRLASACRSMPALPSRDGPAWGWGLLALSALGTAAVALWPQGLFPLVWVAPLGAVLGVQWVLREPTAFAPLTCGDWRPLLLPPLAALVCGFFWELWNFGSLAHWVYTVPYVQRFELFQMPALGYSGYLPFGLECLATASLLASYRSKAIS